MLENLRPADKVTLSPSLRPGIEFDGSEGTATTPGYDKEPENFNEFLVDAGLDPEGIEVIPPVRRMVIWYGLPHTGLLFGRKLQGLAYRYW